ncbi:glycosyltransferase family 2 protein [Gymnodinialimonas ceratoperidinii]|uniref:Glycosyltransferase family 2 protein n=1 Tax=Gymnodinialimonas ceratoperidinii TaxID=2856823 RepID=A0A8F6TZM7_9RHOB|nr:glycosyltransferase family 2 protein [Gymnodinialimonas ceratoperidinii]QXT40651.1 glycosyltransferase family 2 protein [Gymnodinialimonas ceratoperidinii]
MSQPADLIQIGTLQQVTPVTAVGKSGDLPRVSCVTLCHNEVLIVEQFLDHYRALGIEQFYIVDDRSTDGTFEILKEQPDVAVFRPIGDAEFKDNVAAWRHFLLNEYCAGSWVCLPDMDEFLYLADKTRTLPQTAEALDHAGEAALIAAMIDMYADLPINEQRYDGSVPLTQAFPYFDGQGEVPSGLRIAALPKKFARRFPTPPVCFMGGVRERLFFTPSRLSSLKRTLLSTYSNMNRPINPSWLQAWQNRLTRAATKSAFTKSPVILNKFALLKWQVGMKFHRAPHAINTKVPVSESIAALLHFKFYKGVSGFEYNVQRGQHAGGSTMYSTMIDKSDALETSPVCSVSRRFEGVESLKGIVR